MEKIWTIKGILEWTMSYFKDLGITRPRFETELLLASSLGVNRLWLYTNFDKPLLKSELSEFRSAVIRRSKKEPLQYILGKWEFWSLEFIITPNVLIPRKETEHLVELSLKLAKPNLKILDLCTGCGNIVVSLAKELPTALYYATDISHEAIYLARKNAILNHVNDKINLLLGDLLLPFKRRAGGFDMILCNPPYIPSRQIDKLQPEIKGYEPRIALDGGKDGLKFYRRLIRDAIHYLNKSGYLIMEIGSTQSRIIKEMLISCGYNEIQIVKDYNGCDRVIAGRKL